MPTLAPSKPITKTKFASKEQFISALRSSEYIQCKGLMKAGPAHCAMGVYHAISGDPEINSMEPSLSFATRVFNQIAFLNDSGLTFSQISDILEVYLSDDFQSFDYSA